MLPETARPATTLASPAQGPTNNDCGFCKVGAQKVGLQCQCLSNYLSLSPHRKLLQLRQIMPDLQRRKL
jgi:hypothetical protein